tara:strand:+ start:1079 stop:1303 length:225 start_codon:yes stop_codon:yes gene_type:complete
MAKKVNKKEPILGEQLSKVETIVNQSLDDGNIAVSISEDKKQLILEHTKNKSISWEVVLVLLAFFAGNLVGIWM